MLILYLRRKINISIIWISTYWSLERVLLRLWRHHSWWRSISTNRAPHMLKYTKLFLFKSSDTLWLKIVKGTTISCLRLLIYNMILRWIWNSVLRGLRLSWDEVSILRLINLINIMTKSDFLRLIFGKRFYFLYFSLWIDNYLLFLYFIIIRRLLQGSHPNISLGFHQMFISVVC